MASVNKATIIGNLGQDPQIRYMPDGAQVAAISIATTEKWKDKKTGEVQEKQIGTELYSTGNWPRLPRNT